MPRQERNEEHQVDHHEERQARDPGCLPDLWHQDVQDRQSIENTKKQRLLVKRPEVDHYPAFFV